MKGNGTEKTQGHFNGFKSQISLKPLHSCTSLENDTEKNTTGVNCHVFSKKKCVYDKLNVEIMKNNTKRGKMKHSKRNAVIYSSLCVALMLWI